MADTKKPQKTQPGKAPAHSDKQAKDKAPKK